MATLFQVSLGRTVAFLRPAYNSVDFLRELVTPVADTGKFHERTEEHVPELGYYSQKFMMQVCSGRSLQQPFNSRDKLDEYVARHLSSGANDALRDVGCAFTHTVGGTVSGAVFSVAHFHGQLFPLLKALEAALVEYPPTRPVSGRQLGVGSFSQRSSFQSDTGRVIL